MAYSKSPWFKFKPSAWRNDVGLQCCSPAAKGIWMDILCFMHESPEYGYLLLKGGVNPELNLYRLLGLPQKEINQLLTELENNGVFSRRVDDNIIYSRHMVNEHTRSLQNQANGSKGGNPTLVNQGVKPPVKPRIKKREDRFKKDISIDILKKIGASELLNSPEFISAWVDWLANLKELKAKTTKTALKKQLERCKELGLQKALEVVKYSTERAWKGLYEIEKNKNGKSEVSNPKDSNYDLKLR